MEAILIVLPNSERLPRLLDALVAAGAPGATVYESQGQQFLRWIGMHPGLQAALNENQDLRRASKTILTVVPDAAVKAVIDAAAEIMDGFAAPFAGMLCSWPVANFRCFQGDKRQAMAATC